MIALDTNVLVRILVNDEPQQAQKVRDTIRSAEQNQIPILILSEVVLETVWVLESIYQCTRQEVVDFLETLLSVSIFSFEALEAMQIATKQYRNGGDFADHIIVSQARIHQATHLMSFDRKLQKRYPAYVIPPSSSEI